ncbi:MAG: metallophosphoesterase [Planctomycetota bacterium]|nr:metallophosphoesterase [Planctomycetota bacterium]
MRRISNPHLRAALPWLAAWIALTACAFILHALVRLPPEAGLPWFGSGRSAIVVAAANVTTILMLPGWVVSWFIFGPATTHLVRGALLACALGAANWTALALLFDLARRRFRVPRPRPIGKDVDPSRRRFLVDGAFGCTAAAGLGAFAHSTAIEPWRLVTRNYEHPIENLPRSLEGLRIVLIADTHLGPSISASFIRGAIDQALALKPDLALLLGDYVHFSTRYIEPSAELFRPVVERVPLGAIGVLGNHDWYANGPLMSRALTNVGVRMIDNDRLFLRADRTVSKTPSPESLCIAGVGDQDSDTIGLDAALGDVAPETPRLLLAHNPDTAEDPRLIPNGIVAPPRIDLMLSGHTHGGQVRIPFLGTPVLPSNYGQKYSGGLVRGPSCPVLVSRGVGMSIIPVRFGVPPEIVLLTLRSA